MATVPNWIAKGYALDRTDFRHPRAYKVTHWRATPTQAVVELEGRNGEYRFRLNDLRGSGAYCRWMTLVAPDSPEIKAALNEAVRSHARADLMRVIDENPLFGATSTDDLVTAVGRIQRAATKALADLADLL